MKQKKNIFVQIWYVAYPLLFYYAVALIAMSLCQWLLGSDDYVPAGIDCDYDSIYDAVLPVGKLF